MLLVRPSYTTERGGRGGEWMRGVRFTGGFVRISACIVAIAFVLIAVGGSERGGSWSRERPANPPSPDLADATTRGSSGDPPELRSTVLPVGADLSDVIVDPVRPRAYVADRTYDRVLVVDLDTATIALAMSVGREPVALAIDPAGETLYVAHAADQLLVAVDLSTVPIYRTVPTTFFASDLVSPTADTLVVTVRDDTGAGASPYLLNSSDGTVLQALPGGPNPGTLVYGKTDIVLSPDRMSLFIASHWDGSLRRYGRLANDTWAWGTSAFLPGTPRDLAVSPDGNRLYVAEVVSSGGEGLVIYTTGGLSYAGVIGNDRCVQAVDVFGTYVVASHCDTRVVGWNAAGVSTGGVDASDLIEYMRISPDGRTFVVAAGSGSSQNIELLETTEIWSFGPSGFTRNPRPEFSGQLRPLVFPLAEVTATIEVDQTPIPVTYDGGTGFVRGTPSADLADGDHTVSVLAWWSGTVVATSTWPLTVDANPPALTLDPVPPQVDVPTVTISGEAIDPFLAGVNVSGVPVPVDGNGRFSTVVPLPIPGPYTIPVVATDAAGNVASEDATVEFAPPEVWFLHPAKHFRIRVPYGWTAEGNTTVGGASVDVLLEGAGRSVFVAGEPASGQGTSAEAYGLAQATLDDLSALPNFRIVEPLTNLTINGHPAARAALRTMPEGIEIHQILVVVVSGEWRFAWAIVATMAASDLPDAGVIADATIQSFHVLPGGLSPVLSVIGVGAILAVIAIAVAALVLLVRRRRRQPPAPGAASESTPPSAERPGP